MKGYIMLDAYMYTVSRKPMHFEVGKWYKAKSVPFKKKKNFSFCKNIFAIPVMYEYSVYSDSEHLQNRIFEIEAEGIVFNSINYAKATKIRLVREIPQEEWDTPEMRETAEHFEQLFSTHTVC